MYRYHINVARRIAPEGKPFGPYHRHHFSVELEHSAADRVDEVLLDLRVRFPEPDFRVTCDRQNATWHGYEPTPPTEGD